jgi:hypothetical protein
MPYGSVSTDLVVGTNGGKISPENTFGFRNRLINGAMVIDQRNAGASVTNIVGAVYTVDRWAAVGYVASKFTAQQNAGSVTPPLGFTNYLGCTSSSAYTVGSSEYFGIAQYIEGLNVTDLGWGTANAKTVTLLAWVYSSLTGTFGGSLRNSADNYNYPFSYSIPTANTWTQISITVAGPTTGTWLTTNGVGIRAFFSLGAGATFSGTAGSWTSTSTIVSATGATSVVGTSSATFYITGVQLEVGSNATSFEYRPYGTELALCQRYYEKSYNIGTVPGTVASAASITVIAYLSNELNGFTWQVPKRTTPTVLLYDTLGTPGVIGGPANPATAGYLGEKGCGYIGRTGNTVGNGYYLQYTASAEL